MKLFTDTSAILLIGCCVLLLTGCGQRTPTFIAKNPEINPSCIGVLPVQLPIDYTGKMSPAETKALQKGGHALGLALLQEFDQSDKVRFINMWSDQSEYGLLSLAKAQAAATSVGCDAVLETSIVRYRDRVGGKYSVQTPASVSFTYRLYEVQGGQMLCQGSYDETQKPVNANLFDFSTASKRGFVWVTADHILQDGLKLQLGQCAYLLELMGSSVGQE